MNFLIATQFSLSENIWVCRITGMKAMVIIHAASVVRQPALPVFKAVKDDIIYNVGT